jgi:hypothetical protein
LASREKSTIKTRDAGAQCAGARAGACVHDVRAHVHVCARIHNPPLHFFDPPLFLEANICKFAGGFLLLLLLSKKD